MIFTLAAFVIGLVVVTIGCGGGGGNNFIPSTGWKQQDAAYVGMTTCRDCHANIHDQYVGEQPMGIVDPATYYSDQRHTTANCAGCHTTGIGQPTGGVIGGSTPHLDGIGCEACHGPGSKHIVAGSVAERHETITRVPPDKTCIDCHGGRRSTPDGYRPGALDEPFTPVTAEEYSSTKPNSVRGPHQASAGMLFGRYGYGHTEASPSPHSTLPNTCLNCHQKRISSVTGKVDHGAEAQYPVINTSDVNCASCHGGRSSEQLVQIGVKETLIEIGGEDPANPGEPDPNLAGGMFGDYVSRHSIDITTNNDPDNPRVIAYKASRHNYKYVIGEGSLGVHNPGLAKRLLDETKAMLAD
jgi:hypothetical protein